MFFNKKKYLPYGKHSINNTDILRVIKNFKSDFLTQTLVNKFEKNISQKVDSNYAAKEIVQQVPCILHV